MQRKLIVEVQQITQKNSRNFLRGACARPSGGSPAASDEWATEFRKKMINVRFMFFVSLCFLSKSTKWHRWFRVDLLSAGGSTVISYRLTFFPESIGVHPIKPLLITKLMNSSVISLWTMIHAHSETTASLSFTPLASFSAHHLPVPWEMSPDFIGGQIRLSSSFQRCLIGQIKLVFFSTPTTSPIFPASSLFGTLSFVSGLEPKYIHGGSLGHIFYRYFFTTKKWLSSFIPKIQVICYNIWWNLV